MIWLLVVVCKFLDVWCAHIISLVLISLWMTGDRWLSGPGAWGRACGKSSRHCWSKGVVLPLQFRIQRVDKSQVSEVNTDTPTGMHGNHLQAVSTRNGRSWSASSSSGYGREPHVGEQSPVGSCGSCLTTSGRWTSGRGQLCSPRSQVRRQKPEDCKIEVDGEADSGKKLGMRKRKTTAKNRKKSGSKSWCKSNSDGMIC